LQPIYTTMMIAGVVLVVWQGSERVVAGAMTVGGFVAYLELFLRFVNRGHRIPQLVNSIQSGAARTRACARCSRRRSGSRASRALRPSSTVTSLESRAPPARAHRAKRGP
jgi:ABC-type multidrug transport system fused ATPase/permease subunit